MILFSAQYFVLICCFIPLQSLVFHELKVHMNCNDWRRQNVFPLVFFTYWICLLVVQQAVLMSKSEKKIKVFREHWEMMAVLTTCHFNTGLSTSFGWLSGIPNNQQDFCPCYGFIFQMWIQSKFTKLTCPNGV